MFLNPTISHHLKYDSNFQHLKNRAILIDVGTSIGQELHRFVLDIVPFINMYGIDIVNRWDLGFDLLHDHEKFHADYIENDILHLDSSPKE